MRPEQPSLPSTHVESRLVREHEDPARNPYLLNPVRLDPATGAILHWARWDARCWPQGHHVRRWDPENRAWGDEFVMSVPGMLRTRPTTMPEGASAPEGTKK